MTKNIIDYGFIETTETIISAPKAEKAKETNKAKETSLLSKEELQTTKDAIAIIAPKTVKPSKGYIVSAPKAENTKKLNVEFANKELQNKLKADKNYQSIINRFETKENNNRYSKLIESINSSIISGAELPTEIIYDFGLFVSYSVLKKLYSVSGDNTILKLWGKLTSDKSTLITSLDKRSNCGVSDAFDIVQTAVIAVLEMVQYCKDNSILIDTPFTTTRQGKKVIPVGKNIVNDKQWLLDNGFIKEVETTGIIECYKACRRYIASNKKGIRTTKTITLEDGTKKRIEVLNQFCYFSELEKVDNEDNTELEIMLYRRLPKYSDIGSFDSNGNYTTGDKEYKSMEALIASLGLNKSQENIIWLRLRGKGYSEIANTLGITKEAVRSRLNKIKAKCEKVGFIPDKATRATKTA